jgi:hypothetical protein
MSGPFADATSVCSRWRTGDERRTHVAPELVPVSIDHRWCEDCRSYHYFASIRRSSRTAFWSRKAKEVAILFVIGEMIAVGILALAGGVLAATR